MFFEDLKYGKHSHLFLSAFRLGIPLAICQTAKAQSWKELREELSTRINDESKHFEVVSDKYDLRTDIDKTLSRRYIETKFPLGDPLTLRLPTKEFFNIFNLPKYIADKKFAISDSEYSFDNLIWVCSSGVVLIMGKISFDVENLITSNEWEEIIEKHYAELSYIFLEVAQIILKTIPSQISESSLACQSDIETCKNGIHYLKKISDIMGDGTFDLDNFFYRNEEVRDIFIDILIDVYYIEFFFSNKPADIKFRINYDASSIISSYPHYALILSIVYSSFPGFLGIIGHLRERSQFIHEKFGSKFKMDEMITELKMFRIFCLRFINESAPISIRLTREYMEKAEDFWKQGRLHELKEQVDEQLTTIETTLDWIDGIKKEARNFKIGFAAIFIAIISLASVAAQLISTIDYQNYIDANLRICLITLGVVIGIIIGVLIYEWPTRFGLKR